MTPELVAGLWAHLGRELRFAVADKGDSVLMAMGARIVEAVTRTSADAFLSRYVTTLPLPRGVVVYAPFVPGVATDLWPLRAQLYVAVHEAQHAQQWHREGIAWPVLYVASSAWRARYEAEAMRAAETVRWRLERVLYSPAALASGLAGYGCSAGDVGVAEVELALDGETIRAGGVADVAAAVALDWFAAQPRDTEGPA